MPVPEATAPLLEVTGLQKLFPGSGGATVRAVEDVSFSIRKGTIVGLVGESGSGKTTVGRCLLRLVEPTEGTARFDGTDLFALTDRQMHAYRKRLQIVFQDPYSSLNPTMRVDAILGEALDTHTTLRGRAKRERIAQLLEQVGLSAEHGRRFPHEFSGGQRQRIGIARALAVEPEFIVADEPVSALDVSVQAQILNLLQDLQQSLGLTMLFVSHDLAVVEYLCDEVIVMYLGRVVESGPREAIYRRPAHPYTRALISTSPVPSLAERPPRIVLKGDIPSPIAPPSGCVFRTRCPHALPECAQTVPRPESVGPDHSVACLRHGELLT
jgi:oligopeptide/dipeptide ABC transporter ATP-binding protein